MENLPRCGPDKSYGMGPGGPGGPGGLGGPGTPGAPGAPITPGMSGGPGGQAGRGWETAAAYRIRHSTKTNCIAGLDIVLCED